jgi:hypothetical protein
VPLGLPSRGRPESHAVLWDTLANLIHDQQGLSGFVRRTFGHGALRGSRAEPTRAPRTLVIGGRGAWEALYHRSPANAVSAYMATAVSGGFGWIFPSAGRGSPTWIRSWHPNWPRSPRNRTRCASGTCTAPCSLRPTWLPGLIVDDDGCIWVQEYGFDLEQASALGDIVPRWILHRVVELPAGLRTQQIRADAILAIFGDPLLGETESVRIYRLTRATVRER